MSERRLNVFIDESGDFGPYEFHSPYYLVSVVLHDQDNDIGGDIRVYNSRLQNMGYEDHTIHTGPLIRRESVYSKTENICSMHYFISLENLISNMLVSK